MGLGVPFALILALGIMAPLGAVLGQVTRRQLNRGFGVIQIIFYKQRMYFLYSISLLDATLVIRIHRDWF
jgi:hypothetical protein